ncbi:hypothetical protein RUM43_001484 [Polyplax serrata]|uniref:Uncharacterized protein n=1 Tax=Polyplax serrata TaxID=468196 RepID=A0AAN8SDY1_POLSC
MEEGSQNLGCETKRIQIVLGARRTKIVLIFFYRRKKKLKRFAFPRKNEESNHNLNLPNVAEGGRKKPREKRKTLRPNQRKSCLITKKLKRSQLFPRRNSCLYMDYSSRGSDLV